MHKLAAQLGQTAWPFLLHPLHFCYSDPASLSPPKRLLSRVVHLFSHWDGRWCHDFQGVFVPVHNAHLQPQVQAVGCGAAGNGGRMSLEEGLQVVKGLVQVFSCPSAAAGAGRWLRERCTGKGWQTVRQRVAHGCMHSHTCRLLAEEV